MLDRQSFICILNTLAVLNVYLTQPHPLYEENLGPNFEYMCAATVVHIHKLR